MARKINTNGTEPKESATVTEMNEAVEHPGTVSPKTGLSATRARRTAIALEQRKDSA